MSGYGKLIVLAALTPCDRCGAVIPDTDEARFVHDDWHDRVVVSEVR